MRIQYFDLSESDEEAFSICRRYLESVTDNALKVSNVDVVRWALHRAALGVLACCQDVSEEEQTTNGK